MACVVFANRQFVILLLVLWCRSCTTLTIRELDDIFNDDECIEGEFALENTNVRNSQHTQSSQDAMDYPSSSKNLILIKARGISLSSKSPADSSLLIEIKKMKQDEKNALNIINELAQLNNISIEFILIAEMGEPHDKTFRVRLNLGEEIYQGSGKRIVDAKRAVATNALSNTKYSRPPAKSREQIERNVQQLTPTVHLNNIAGKLGMKVEYYNEGGNVFIDNSAEYHYYSLDSTSRGFLSKLNGSYPTGLKSPSVENDASRGPFRVRVDVGDESFIGAGWTVQAARHDAAEKALELFRKMSLQDADECLSGGRLCNKLNIKSPISLLHEIAAKHQWDLAFDVISDAGPAHKKLFVTRCKMFDLTAEGEGSSKKESKRKAAEAMLKMLENVQPWDLINVQGVRKARKKKKNKKNKIVRPDALRQTMMNVLDAFSTMPVAGADDIQSDDAHEKGPKGELLTLGREIGIQIRFSSYQNEDDDRHGSLVSLDTQPAYHCYSKHQTAHQAEENAALNALKFLKHVGLDNIVIPLKDPEGKKIIMFEETNRLDGKMVNGKQA